MFLGILREQFSVLNLAKHWTTYYTAHEIIDPRDTRAKIIRALQSLAKKQEPLPKKNRFIKPA
jgi:acetyl-CoA carboxylase carboxyltransferase component